MQVLSMLFNIMRAYWVNMFIMAPRAEIIDLNSVVLLQEILLLLQGKMIWTPLFVIFYLLFFFFFFFFFI